MRYLFLALILCVVGCRTVDGPPIPKLVCHDEIDENGHFYRVCEPEY